ncbi:hypothetical protein PSHT_05415 [Puccinia striiformis]|uniref:Uncharacterized protein n=1 Tax=Puccinia striiformis TaxID=27350 RepID=A0A2S4WAJ9_9BASI|nr:hypothetical protein PSHT_05415 [Puccinia striiformis]
MPDHQTPPPLTTRLKEDLPLSTDGLTGEGCGRSTEENLHMLAMICRRDHKHGTNRPRVCLVGSPGHQRSP